ncbi:YigZ family protein, partial [Wenyingzhuangia sp. 1_MG-2023]|nr:YigZ family protein [Wenyingzhuangia sp. 1_MG-2023]
SVMTSVYAVPVTPTPHISELEIKRSQFITFVGQASDRAAAEAFIRSVRQLHPQARHVCWAYIAGAPDTTVMSMSDDGEPSGTAGRPMLKVLQHSGLGEIVVAVVRYFGGIKLGTG